MALLSWTKPKDLSKKSPFRTFNNDNMRNSRVSPTESTFEFAERVPKSSFNARRRKGSGSSSSLGSFRGGKFVRKTFINQNFSQRECFKYVETLTRKGTVQCECGQTKEKHPHDFVLISDPSFNWSVEECTRTRFCNTYGEIEFQEDTATRKPYIRISHDTEASKLMRLLIETWELDIPNLVISVTGGAKSFQLKPKLKEAFTKGLIKCAVTTNAWIITGGTNTGVMKRVGEAVKHRGSVAASMNRSKINVIGVAPWGVLEEPHKLVSKGDGKYPAHYSCEDFDASKTGLDYNHSHFLLVDNGTSGKYGTEIKLRSRVESEFATYDIESKKRAVKGTLGVPVVILCLEGGPNTIKTMVEAISKGTPAVVIDGSGRAADVVAFAFKHLIYDKESDFSVIDPEFEDDILQKLEDVFGVSNKATVYQDIKDMLRNENMVTIFRLDDESGQSDMDLAILRALLKANKANFQAQLKLALAWNRIDVAESEIFTEDTKRDKFRVEDLYKPLMVALVDNKPDFVELFFNEGINPKQFLTLDRLEHLYVRVPPNSALKQMIKENMPTGKQEGGSLLNMAVIGEVMEDLMGDRFKSRYKKNPSYCKGDCKTSRGELKMAHENGALLQPAEEGNKELNAQLDLFTWAVLCNRRELAYNLWKRAKDSIACALMASKLLKSLSIRISQNKELADMVDDLLEHAEQYETMAVGVLDQCRMENEGDTQTLLVKELEDFGFLTSLDIAVSANNEDFIAHPSCQTLLSRLWMGALYINTELWKILVSIFIPVFVKFLITFREDNEFYHSKEEDDFTSSQVIINNNASRNVKPVDDPARDESISSQVSIQKDGLQNATHFELEEAKSVNHTGATRSLFRFYSYEAMIIAKL